MTPASDDSGRFRVPSDVTERRTARRSWIPASPEHPTRERTGSYSAKSTESLRFRLPRTRACAIQVAIKPWNYVSPRTQPDPEAPEESGRNPVEVGARIARFSSKGMFPFGHVNFMLCMLILWQDCYGLRCAQTFQLALLRHFIEHLARINLGSSNGEFQRLQGSIDHPCSSVDPPLSPQVVDQKDARSKSLFPIMGYLAILGCGEVSSDRYYS